MSRVVVTVKGLTAAHSNHLILSYLILAWARSFPSFAHALQGCWHPSTSSIPLFLRLRWRGLEVIIACLSSQRRCHAVSAPQKYTRIITTVQVAKRLPTSCEDIHLDYRSPASSARRHCCRHWTRMACISVTHAQGAALHSYFSPGCWECDASGISKQICLVTILWKTQLIV
jgi:hypothetical protein